MGILKRISIACLFVFIACSGALAQSTLTGIVKDQSGAVLPGVAIEASSLALIEKSRSTITDEGGAYKIIDLRPGNYAVTFSLPGFKTVKRDVELPSNFTATINAEMAVGGVEETITVSAESPVVDVQTNFKAQVLPREILDTVPTAHTIQSVGQLVVGVQMDVPDVGGSRAMQQTYFVVHGAGTAQTSVLMDGMIVNGLQNDGAVQSYMNDAGAEQMVYQTGGGTADTPTGGMKLNVSPKEGGNEFHGSIFAGFEGSGLQSNNLSPSLAKNGVRVVDKIGTYRDIDGTLGGPIIKDKLWFFGSTRFFTVNKPVANAFWIPDGRTYADCVNAVVACRQAVNDQSINSVLLRLTWQVSPRNKLSAYMDRLFKTRDHDVTAGVDPKPLEPTGIRRSMRQAPLNGLRQSVTGCWSKAAIRATSNGITTSMNPASESHMALPSGMPAQGIRTQVSVPSVTQGPMSTAATRTGTMLRRQRHTSGAATT